MNYGIFLDSRILASLGSLSLSFGLLGRVRQQPRKRFQPQSGMGSIGACGTGFGV